MCLFTNASIVLTKTNLLISHSISKLTFQNLKRIHPVVHKLLTLEILPYVSFLCFNLGKIALCACDILEFQHKIIDEDTEHYLFSNVLMTVIYDKGNSHCQIYYFCVVGYLRKTLTYSTNSIF